jgi:hypothetical protein
MAAGGVRVFHRNAEELGIGSRLPVLLVAAIVTALVVDLHFVEPAEAPAVVFRKTDLQLVEQADTLRQNAGPFFEPLRLLLRIPQESLKAPLLMAVGVARLASIGGLGEATGMLLERVV